MSVWRDVPGFEGLYQVRIDGTVKSLGRETVGGSRGGPCVKHYKPKILIPVQGGRNRARSRVNLFYNTQGGGSKKISIYIVDIVRKAFGANAADALPRKFQKSKCTSAIPLSPEELI